MIRWPDDSMIKSWRTSHFVISKQIISVSILQFIIIINYIHIINYILCLAVSIYD